MATLLSGAAWWSAAPAQAQQAPHWLLTGRQTRHHLAPETPELLVADLAAGTYWLELRTEASARRMRFVVQH